MSWKAFLSILFILHPSYFTVLVFQFLAPVFPHRGLPHWELLLVHYRGCCPVDRSGPGGWRTLHLGVGPLVCPGRDCLCGGAPCGHGPGALSVWSAPQGGSFLALGLGARPCFCLIGAVGLSLCVCVCLCLSGYLWGWEGWYVLSLFLASVRHFVLLLKYERWHANKIWFDFNWFAVLRHSETWSLTSIHWDLLLRFALEL